MLHLLLENTTFIKIFQVTVFYPIIFLYTLLSIRNEQMGIQSFPLLNNIQSVASVGTRIGKLTRISYSCS